MLDSNVIPFMRPGMDFTDPDQVRAFVDALPPARPNMRDIGAFLIRTHTGSTANFRVTRAALEKLEGSGELSTPMIAQRHFDAIEEQCRALYARTAAQPITGWVLDAADLI